MTTFVQHPIKYLRYAAREKPSYFWSLVLGIAGPVAVIAVPKIRKDYFGYVPPESWPKSYPRKLAYF
ncbi:10166_t:CDS:2 [Paraglomus brasilianum]|uniref:10166_t:CDS:1 n=1 Tax=Paraglomus brasilianum TaxID=144538 RepID=A0A9N9CM09_9GLOM|nr:10166_t:CDS:2 [Paraglomus brasilianum]